jgi:hypothetical protein
MSSVDDEKWMARRAEDLDTLARGAALLREDAASLRESCRGSRRNWACDDCQQRFPNGCPAKARHELLHQAARALDRMAKRKERQGMIRG